MHPFDGPGSDALAKLKEVEKSDGYVGNSWKFMENHAKLRFFPTLKLESKLPNS